MGSPATAPRALDRLRSAAEDVVDGLRRSDRFARMRIAALVAWLALSAATFVVACPSSGPGNSLGADVQVQHDAIVGGENYMVRNESDEVWTRVVVTLDGAWTFRQATLRPGDLLVVSTGQFRRGSEAPPAGHAPRRLEVECDQGSHEVDLR
jgi:hypothetical protein